MAGLCSLNELKDYLRIPSAETGLDTTLTTLISDALARAEKRTERTFLATGYANEVYPGNALQSLLLKNYPVDDAATFQLKDYNVDTGLTILDTADYAVDYEFGIVRLRGGLVFAEGPDSVRVTYTAGYSTTGTGDDEKLDVPGMLPRESRVYCAAMFRYQQNAITKEEMEAAEECFDEACALYARIR